MAIIHHPRHPSSKRRKDQPFLLWCCNHLQVWSALIGRLSGSNYIQSPLLSITSKCQPGTARARCILIADHSDSSLHCDSLRLTSTADMLPFCTNEFCWVRLWRIDLFVKLSFPLICCPFQQLNMVVYEHGCSSIWLAKCGICFVCE